MMRLNLQHGSLLIALLMTTAFSRAAPLPDSSLLHQLLRTLPEEVREIIKRPQHEVQILYTQIDRPESSPVQFQEHALNVDPQRYFYPASTVKLPVALLALEKLGALDVTDLNRDTPMLTDAVHPWQTERHEDASALSGMPSIGHDVRKIFLVSDNDSFNRLFEFVGMQHVHERLHKLRLSQTHIVHRLSVPRELDHSSYGNPIRFLDEEGSLLYRQPESFTSQSYYQGQIIQKGLGHMVNGTLVKEPKDFTHNNAFPLTEQQRLLRAFIFPKSVPASQRVLLSDDNREFALNVMSQYPRECQDTTNDALSPHEDTYAKPFLAWQESPIRESLRCYNKIGQAYGYLVDNAYIIDRDSSVEFFLAAVIHTNANQIFNDDVYEYDTLGKPFFKALGETIYKYEQQRKR
ncbi:MAG: serine hydrolase [Verrucomicrobiales bacterium]|jgi:hypothetical protein